MKTALDTATNHRDIVVIGGSSGAAAPLKTILGALAPDLPAAVFVVLHVPARSLGLLATVTAAATHLPVRAAADGMAIRPGTVTLGVPDRHLLLAEGSSGSGAARARTWPGRRSIRCSARPPPLTAPG